MRLIDLPCYLRVQQVAEADRQSGVHPAADREPASRLVEDEARLHTGRRFVSGVENIKHRSLSFHVHQYHTRTDMRLIGLPCHLGVQQVAEAGCQSGVHPAADREPALRLVENEARLHTGRGFVSGVENIKHRCCMRSHSIQNEETNRQPSFIPTKQWPHLPPIAGRRIATALYLGSDRVWGGSAFTFINIIHAQICD